MKKTMARLVIAGFVAPGLALAAPAAAFAGYADYVLKDNVKKDRVLEIVNEIESENLNFNELTNVQGQHQDQEGTNAQGQAQDQDQVSVQDNENTQENAQGQAQGQEGTNEGTNAQGQGQGQGQGQTQDDSIL
ncbi:hypothetical protein [Nocardiopsis sp. LOL_012]|uniref:hypothetical protein n=1 Tax=Nocardiopsis sp. LOL_012 TaxID=3345409 RepID=UPI003A89B55C